MRRALTASRQQIRTFIFTSYGQNDFANPGNADQLDALIGNTTHVTLALHLRVPTSTSNEPARGPISETPSNIGPYVDLCRTRGLRVGLIIILFIDEWDWAGNWHPSSPATALSNYYTAIQPWVVAAQAAGIDWICLADEWSELYYSYPTGTIVPAFTSLFNAARADYGGPLTININWGEEPACNPGIVALTDFAMISAYVPLTNSATPTYAEMKANLLGPSAVPAVRNQVDEYAAIWQDQSVTGYMSYLRHMAEIEWSRDLLLHTGYKSTVGGAIAPGDDIEETTVDTVTQDRAWRAFIDAAHEGIGPRLRGISGWRWWPTATSDPMGYTPQGKPAAASIMELW
jgi:hypothetical protein